MWSFIPDEKMAVNWICFTNLCSSVAIPPPYMRAICLSKIR